MILGNFYALGVTMFNKYSSCRNINNLTFFVYHCLKDVVLLVLFSFIPLLSSLGKTPMKKELSETRRYRYILATISQSILTNFGTHI